jgi:hypothetical protein
VIPSSWWSTSRLPTDAATASRRRPAATVRTIDRDDDDDDDHDHDET